MIFLTRFINYNKVGITSFSIFIISAVISYFSIIPLNHEQRAHSKYFQKFSVGDDDRYSRDEQEFMMLRDPATNQIPANIFRLEQQFASNLPKRISNNLNKSNGTNAITWTIRGPNNVGGRTRALGIDVRTTSPPNVTIIAGGVSGGIWRSSNDGSSWNLVILPSQLHNTTCIAQDKRSGSQDIWYVGSGEVSRK